MTCLDAMCKIATALGRKDEAEDFAVRKEKLNVLIHQTFYNDEENIYATGSQLDMSYPMLVGAVPDALYDKVKQEMLARSAGQYKRTYSGWSGWGPYPDGLGLSGIRKPISCMTC